MHASKNFETNFINFDIEKKFVKHHLDQQNLHSMGVHNL